jgi:hypothetical protein
LANAENTTVPGELKKLAAGACSAQNAALPLQVQTVPQASLDQKLQLLAGQGALPAMFAAANAPATLKTLVKAGDVADFQAELTKLGVINDVEPAAISTIQSLYGGFYVLPDEFNIEGNFHNKKVFTGNGIVAPQTWGQLTAAAAKLAAKGIQPFSASGQQGWPITRLVSGYLFRSVGPDALSAVAAGSAKLTDPSYVGAAQAIASLGAKGYFGKGVGSIDYDTSVNALLTGKAAMLYMGSWVLSNVADTKADTVGAANIAPVAVRDRDPATLESDASPPVRCTQQVTPVSIARRGDGSYLLDFGQNLVGRLAITVAGPAGGRVTMRHAEEVIGGELATGPLRQARATDEYILRGGGTQSWEPRFTIHGFRYATITGWPGELRATSAIARVYHTDMPRAGEFTCSEPLVQRLHDNVRWSVRGNLVAIPTDCPARDERLGWTGDVQVFGPTALFLYDCAALLDSWLADVSLEQLPDGTVPWYVPVIPGAPPARSGEGT